MRFTSGAGCLLAVLLVACSPKEAQNTTLERVMLDHGIKHAATSAPTDVDEHPVQPGAAPPAP